MERFYIVWMKDEVCDKTHTHTRPQTNWGSKTVKLKRIKNTTKKGFKQLHEKWRNETYKKKYILIIFSSV